jgi:hypothetical protein
MVNGFIDFCTNAKVHAFEEEWLAVWRTILDLTDEPVEPS